MEYYSFSDYVWVGLFRGSVSLRLWDYYFLVKFPNDKPLFSERYGYDKTKFKMFGYRLFVYRGPERLMHQENDN